MTNPNSSTVREPTSGPAALHAWRRDAALRLGADEAVARQFGITGHLVLDGKPLSLHPMSDKPTGPWLATVCAGRPAGVDEERWCDALLQASSQSLLVTQAAFGLAEEGDAVIVLRIPERLDDPALLAVEVAGLVALRRAVIEGAVAPPQHAAHPAAIGWRILDQGPADLPHRATDIVHLDAPEDVLVMIHAAMLHLGRTAAQALAATRTGKVEIDGRCIGLTFDFEGAGLVIAAELGPRVLDSPPQRRAAAMANTDLMAFIGMAVVRERGQARLMTRWCLPGESAESFAGRLCEVARLANAIVQRHSAHASH